MIGKTLLHYEITARIGAGGMGEVYRARDTTLGRDVAIKVLPESFASDPERLARFEREARLLAALNHPHIAQVYGFEQHEGTRFLVLELAEGEDLSERLSRGPIPVDEAIQIAKQIAEALEEAHEKGIVHRDLKPGNVKLGPDGKAKVLDFGLAKAWAGDPDPRSTSSVELSQSPTLAHAGTQAGVILGTAAYMSPEQARGKPVDKRADIWAFGVVLHEMLTGRPLFTGETVSDVLAAVLTRDADPKELPPKTPAAVRRVLQRTLVRDPRQRLRDIGEARVELADTRAAEPSASVAGGDAAGAQRRPSPWWLVATTAAGVALGFALWGGVGEEPRLPALKLQLAPPSGLPGPRRQPRISPDGASMAYISGGRLWVQSLAQLTPVAVPGSEDTFYFTWSPDARSLAFVAGSRILRGGPTGDARLVAETPEAPERAGGLVWTADDRIVFATGGGGLLGVAASGGTLSPLLEPLGPAERDFHAPAPMANGRGAVFVVHRNEPGGMDTLGAWIDGERHTIYQEEGATFTSPVWSGTGHVLFARVGPRAGVWALPFDLDAMQPRGEPFLVAGQAVSPSVSRDGGTLLLSSWRGGGEQELVLVSREGVVERVLAEPMPHVDHATISPDGRWLAACIYESKGASVWTLDLERRSRNRLWPDADCGESGGGIAWMSDGLRVAYFDTQAQELRVRRADGADAGSVLATGTHPDFSRDGRYLVFALRDPDSDWDIWSQRLDETSEPAAWLASPAGERRPVLSPDGRWLAYESDETGRPEVYVRPFPAGAGKWQASFEGGLSPRWSQDGARLFFVGQGALQEVAVETRDGLALSNPRELFSMRDTRLALGHGYSTAPDGGLVAVRTGEEESSPADLLLMTSWVDDDVGTVPP